MTKADARLIRAYAALRCVPWRPLVREFDRGSPGQQDVTRRMMERVLSEEGVQDPNAIARVTRDGGKNWQDWN